MTQPLESFIKWCAMSAVEHWDNPPDAIMEWLLNDGDKEKAKSAARIFIHCPDIPDSICLASRVIFYATCNRDETCRARRVAVASVSWTGAYEQEEFLRELGHKRKSLVGPYK